MSDTQEEFDPQAVLAEFHDRVLSLRAETVRFYRFNDFIVTLANDGSFGELVERVDELANFQKFTNEEIIEALGQPGPDVAAEFLDPVLERKQGTTLAIQWDDLKIIHDAGLPWPTVEPIVDDPEE